MNIKVLVATHKSYKIPREKCYLPIHVGKSGKEDIGYIGDDTKDNISKKNPYYCELTGLYWGVKNLECDYIGLVHYRRHFSEKNPIFSCFINKFDNVLSENKIKKILRSSDVILPKKRKYYIETIYSHYANTHYSEHLDYTREIIENIHPDYLKYFDKVMKRRSAHMFNMFIMKKSLADKYCEWLFSILEELEGKVDITKYDAFQARLFGRVSELLLDVWLEKNKLSYTEVPYIHMEYINWVDKIVKFIKAKFSSRKYEKSF